MHSYVYKYDRSIFSVKECNATPARPKRSASMIRSLRFLDNRSEPPCEHVGHVVLGHHVQELLEPRSLEVLARESRIGDHVLGRPHRLSPRQASGPVKETPPGGGAGLDLPCDAGFSLYVI